MWAQIENWENPNFHTIEKDSIQEINLGEVSVIEETLKVFSDKNVLKANLDYIFDAVSNQLIFNQPTSVRIEYYTYPTELTQTVYAKDTHLIVERKEEERLYEFRQGMTLPKKSAFENLNTQGSLVRGISFGNNQGASVQSSLNLNMEGKLSQTLNIKAHLADYNIPIEQNGFTQQINEFENIYLSVFNQNSSLNAGFIDLSIKDSYFANFNKKLTGIQLNTRLTHTNAKTDISTTASISRGAFNRIRFQGIEGNQGPYQLKGKNNENYIVIIPRSERVYIDGILLEEGIEGDYTINYNTGELNFTSKKLISQNYRITVEYQYTALRYNRFLLHGKMKHQREKWNIQASIYSESDAKNSPRTDDLTEQEQQILAMAGNDPNAMWSSTAKESEYSENRILYKITSVNNTEVFEYSTNAEETLYAVGFTDVGAQNGDYIKVETTLNGTIYEYVAPLNGVPQGSYIPARQLVAPESRQVYEMDTEYTIKNGGIALNMALSQNDKNTISSLNDNENTGYALRGKVFKEWKWNDWRLIPALEYSFVQQNFFIIDRINKIEFNRDFNVSSEFDQKDQHQANFSLGLLKKDFRLQYSLDFLDRKESYQGNSQFIDLDYKWKDYTLKTDVLLNQNTRLEGEGNVQDYQVSVEKPIGKNLLSVGTNGRMEYDSFTDNSYLNDQNNQRYFIKNVHRDSLKLSYSTELYLTKNDTLQLNRDNRSNAQGVILNTQWKPNSNDWIELNAHYRHVNNEERIFQSTIEESHLLSELKWTKNLLKNAMRFNFQYWLGNGNEPQRAFEYVEVSDGNGIYKWTDYNADGLQDLDEFEVAEFQDLANYVRVYTQTQTFVKTAKNGFGLSWLWKPSDLWNTDFAKRWNLRANYRTESSYTQEGKTIEFNPFKNENIRFRNSNVFSYFSFNDIDQQKWELSYQFTLNEVLRNYFLGEESLYRRGNQLTFSYRLWRYLIWQNQLQLNEVRSFSESLENKNYKIPSQKMRTALQYKYLNDLRAEAFFQYQEKENTMGIEKLYSREWGANLEYSRKKSSILASFGYIINGLEGNAQSLVANQMMEGFKQGENMVWNLSVQQQLANFLYLNIVYEGRKSDALKTIHIGNVQVKFVF